MNLHKNNKLEYTTAQKIIIFCLSISIIVFAMPGRSTGFCAFIEPILKSTELSRDLLSAILMCTTLIGGLSMLIIGKVIDNVGTRKSLLVSLALWTMTMATLGHYKVITDIVGQHINKTLVHLIFFGLTLSATRLLGQNILTSIGHVQIMRCFQKRTGIMISFVNVVVALAFGVSPKFLNTLIVNAGWENTYNMFSVISCILLLIALFFLREIIEDDKQKNKKNRVSAPTIFSKKDIFKEKNFWCIVCSLCVNSFIGSGIVIHAVDIFRESGASASSAMNCFIYIGITSMISGMLFGRLIDMNKAKFALLLMLSAQLIGMINLEWISNKFSLVVYSIAIGCSWGGYGIFFSAIWAKIFPIKNLGEVNGTICFFTILTGSSSILLMSLSKSLTGSYFTIIHIIEALVIVAALFVIRHFKIEQIKE